MSNEDSLVNKLLDRICKRRKKIGISRSRRVKVFVETANTFLNLIQGGLSIFSPEISKFFYSKEDRYILYLDT